MKPLLAATLTDVTLLHFPWIASPKLDGIRCLLRGGLPVSRTLKPIPNRHIQDTLAGDLADCPHELDGELMLDGLDFNHIQSAVMSEHGTPAFTYYVFDRIAADATPYSERLSWLQAQRFPACVRVLESCLIEDLEALFAYEARCIAAGHEGVMLDA